MEAPLWARIQAAIAKEENNFGSFIISTASHGIQSTNPHKWRARPLYYLYIHIDGAILTLPKLLTGDPILLQYSHDVSPMCTKALLMETVGYFYISRR